MEQNGSSSAQPLSSDEEFCPMTDEEIKTSTELYLDEKKFEIFNAALEAILAVKKYKELVGDEFQKSGGHIPPGLTIADRELHNIKLQTQWERHCTQTLKKALQPKNRVGRLGAGKVAQENNCTPAVPPMFIFGGNNLEGAENIKPEVDIVKIAKAEPQESYTVETLRKVEVNTAIHEDTQNTKPKVELVDADTQIDQTAGNIKPDQPDTSKQDAGMAEVKEEVAEEHVEVGASPWAIYDLIAGFPLL